MGTLYLVRHGQASFGSDDYDRLSALGQRQCEQLGRWFAAHRIGFDAVLTGTLRRHAQSLAAIEAGLGAPAATEPQALPGLNEYDSEAVIRAVHAGALAPVATAEAAREHFRLLRQGLAQWMAGTVQPQGLPAHREFADKVMNALDAARQRHAEGCVLVVSSGGPISVALGRVLGLAAEAVIELNLHLRNSALSELRMSSQRFGLVSFNTLPHLAAPEHREWITHA